MSHANKLLTLLFFVSSFCHAEILSTTAVINFNGLNLSPHGSGLTNLEIVFSIADDAIDLAPEAITHGLYEADFSISANGESAQSKGLVQFRDLTHSNIGYLDQLLLTIPIYSGKIPGVNLNTKITEFKLHFYNVNGDMLSSAFPRDLNPFFAEHADNFRYWFHLSNEDGTISFEREQTADSIETANFSSAVYRYAISIPEPSTTSLFFAGLVVVVAIKSRGHK